MHEGLYVRLLLPVVAHLCNPSNPDRGFSGLLQLTLKDVKKER